MSARLAPLEPPFTPAVDDALRRLMGPVEAEPLALFRTIAHHEALLDRFRAPARRCSRSAACAPTSARR